MLVIAPIDGDEEVRGQLLSAVTRLPAETGLDASIQLLAGVNPAEPSAAPGPVEAAWRRFVGDRARLQQADRFIELTRSGSAAERTLAYAVLVQSVRSNRTPEAVRNQVTPVIEAAWANPTAAGELVQAIRVMRAESQYTDRLQAYTPASR